MIETLKTYDNGGKIEVYRSVDRLAHDYANVYACCDYFARHGAHAVITPRFSETIGNPAYHTVYASLENTPYWGKCPDFCVNGVWYEHEGYDESKDLDEHPKKRVNTFSKMLNRGIKQSDRIVVEDCQIGRRWAKKAIYSRVHFEKQKISEIYIRTAEGLELLYKKEAG
jgi:hypothetical protein